MSEEVNVSEVLDIYDSISDHAVALWGISDLLAAANPDKLDDAVFPRLSVLLHTVGFSLIKTNEIAQERHRRRD